MPRLWCVILPIAHITQSCNISLWKTICLAENFVEALCFLWQETQHRLNYLLDVHMFSKEDLDLNSMVLVWPQNILPIFELNREVQSFQVFAVSHKTHLLQRGDEVFL